MTRSQFSTALATLWLTILGALSVAYAQGNTSTDFTPPAVFQAAGPTKDSIQGTVQAYREALGDPNNANLPRTALVDPTRGRREINWDGGGANTNTDDPVTPFNNFLDARGAQFTTPGIGLAQAPPSGGAQGGPAALFDNPTYGTIFTPFSTPRLFTPVGSNITDALFFVPGTNGTVPAAVRGFGAVFTDVDQPNGSGPAKKQGNRKASTLIEYFGADGHLLFSSFVPAAPGDACRFSKGRDPSGLTFSEAWDPPPGGFFRSFPPLT